MNRTTTFTKGSGVYTCRCCGRSTRDDGNGDSVHIQLCTQCFELGGIENQISDSGKKLSQHDTETVKANIALISERGGLPGVWDDLQRTVDKITNKDDETKRLLDALTKISLMPYTTPAADVIDAVRKALRGTL